MNVSLTPHFNDFIKSLVASGKYHSASEVVRDALRLLQEKHESKSGKLNEIQKLINEGMESGEAEDFDLNQFLKEANEAYKNAK